MSGRGARKQRQAPAKSTSRTARQTAPTVLRDEDLVQAVVGKGKHTLPLSQRF
jgi:hypothetical protein